MNYTDYYYDKIVGIEPTQEDRIKTDLVIQHLLDNQIEQEEIYAFLDTCDCKDFLTHKDLKNDLWNGSLLRRNVFYYHRELQITSKAPSLNGSELVGDEFFLEMRIKYTKQDIIKYFYNKCKLPDLANKKQDEGSIEFLIKKYSKVKFIEPVDFILSLIDYASANQDNMFSKVRSILDLCNNESEVYDILKSKTDEASSLGFNKIVWR